MTTKIQYIAFSPSFLRTYENGTLFCDILNTNAQLIQYLITF